MGWRDSENRIKKKEKKTKELNYYYLELQKWTDDLLNVEHIWVILNNNISYKVLIIQEEDVIVIKDGKFVKYKYNECKNFVINGYIKL